MKAKEIILKTLELKGNWTPSFDLEKVNTPFGWVGTSGSRRCRELAEAGIIDKKIEGRYVYYRTKSTKTYQSYKVEGTEQIVKVLI